jgi:hypothetical protein
MNCLIALAMLPGSGQLAIPRVGLLPDRPSPYVLRDWLQTAREYDRVVFDEGAKGPWLPLVWRVPGAPNLQVPGFGMPSYVGKEELRGKTGEGIAAMGSLLGATAIGIDKLRWVELTPQFLNPTEGTVLNNAGGRSGSSFWYELLPSVVFTQLASRYPNWPKGRAISKGVADAWRSALDALGGDFDHTSFLFAGKQPVDNNQWKEPDAAAAVAYLQLFEGLRSGDAGYVSAARRALTSLQKREDNPTYEILTAYGALAAAYLNAERGDRWDVPRFVDWCFDPTSPNRVGWGMIAGRWGRYDVGGLMGSTNDGGGYAFAMNTFLNLATLAPIARYDDRFSAALAKWVLNASNAARLFYKDSLPADHQSGRDWPGDPNAGIAYEALRRTWEGKSPYAAGDAKRNGWAKEDFGLYGGGYVGLLAALVHRTNVPEILRIDLRATDFLPVRAYPTDLFWNPYSEPKIVLLDLGPKAVRPYDAVSNRFLSLKAVRGTYKLHLGPKQTLQVVRVPAQGALTYSKNRTLVGGVTIDANNGRFPLPTRVLRVRKDASVRVRTPRATAGKVDWAKAEPITLSAGAMRADLRFAWDAKYLYFRLEQRAPATEMVEAPTVAELRKHRWDFEHVELSLDPSRETFPIAAVPEISLGWSSRGLRDLAYSDDLPSASIQVATSGTAAAANRTIQGRIEWAALYRTFGTKEPMANIVRRVAKIGCQPLLVDGTFRRQAYLNGKPYTRPTGFDQASRTLVLE